MPGLCLDYARVMFGLCPDYVWIMPGLCLDYARIMRRNTGKIRPEAFKPLISVTKYGNDKRQYTPFKEKYGQPCTDVTQGDDKEQLLN